MSRVKTHTADDDTADDESRGRAKKGTHTHALNKKKPGANGYQSYVSHVGTKARYFAAVASLSGMNNVNIHMCRYTPMLTLQCNSCILVASCTYWRLSADQEETKPRVQCSQRTHVTQRSDDKILVSVVRSNAPRLFSP